MPNEIEKNERRWKILQRQVQERRIETAFAALDECGVGSLLIKGWAAARNYPQPFERLSVDIDAAVAPADFTRSEEILKRRKITGVDLHKGLRHLDKLDWEDLYERAETLQIGDTPVKMPCAEDHLRILCVHWLGDGGADKQRLQDIYYAVANRPVDFDWDRCLNSVGATRRRWVACAVGLAEKYFGLDLSETPLANDAARHPPRWLVKTVEREWSRNVRLKPLYSCLMNGENLIEQLKIRFPPNALQATIDMEGAIDEKTRIPHQIGSIFKRSLPSLRRIGRMTRAGDWRKR